MPMYEFICGKCLKVLEFIVPLDKYEKKLRCPYCRKSIKRILSPVLFRIH